MQLDVAHIVVVAEANAPRVITREATVGTHVFQAGGTGHVRAYWAVVFLDSNNVATTLREQLKERKATMADTSVAMARLGREFHDCECVLAGWLPALEAQRKLVAGLVGRPRRGTASMLPTS